MTAGGGNLVLTAARLRLALLRGSLRAGPGATSRRIGLAIGALVGGSLSVLAAGALAVSRGHGHLPGDLSVLLFTGLTLGWVVLPVLAFASDDLLDPAKLALLPLTGRQMLTVMGTGALIGVAPVASLVAALGLLPATATGPASWLVALLAVVLLLALCVSASRACTSALSGVLRSRRGRDLGVALAAVVGLSVQFGNAFLQVQLHGDGADQGTLHRIAGLLQWTPPGLLARAPGRSLPAAVGSLVLVAALVGVLLVLWQRSVRRSLERVESSGGRRRRDSTLAPGWLPVPAGRTGAIMAKDLRYLTREPRRMVSTVTTSLLPVLALVLGPVAANGGKVPPQLVFGVCGVGLLSSLTAGNRFGMDGTGTWMLISSATDARDARRDLLGGDLAIAVVVGPVLLLIGVLICALSGGWEYLPAALGLAYALYAVGVAFAGLLSVMAPFAIPESQNAFGGGSTGQGCSAGLLGLAAAALEVLLCLPLLALLIPSLIFSSDLWGFALLIVGPGYGILIGSVIRRFAAARWSERGPEVLQALSAGR